MAKRCGFPPIYKIERVEKMSAKRVFFCVLQKIVVICCAIFFGFANAFAANLPAGYTELEYIESTGSQYINTEIGTSSITKTEVVGQFTGLVSNTFIFGKTNNGTSRYGWGEYIYPYGAANKFLWNYGGWGVVTNADLNKHTFGIDTKNGLVYIDNTQFDTSQTSSAGANPAFVSDNLPIYLFARNSGSVSGYAKAKIYSVKMWNNNELTHEFVPAKYVSGSTTIYGMYDTFTGVFYQNAGTGTFTAGPVVLDQCRNLFDKDGTYVNGYVNANTGVLTQGALQRCFIIPCKPNTTYTLSGMTANSTWGSFTSSAFNTTATTKITGNGSLTTGPNDKYIIGLALAYSSQNVINVDYRETLQVEQGSTATAYVPFCANLIKIATTAYNTARFSPVMNDLNSTIATIRDVVTNTINQTKAIADLQAKKQTRPDEQCPAGKKCLLVEDNDGVPHWYEIIENIYGLPTGYTPLEYIQSSGTQYIDPDINITSANISTLKTEAIISNVSQESGSISGYSNSSVGRLWYGLSAVSPYNFYYSNGQTEAKFSQTGSVQFYKYIIDAPSGSYKVYTESNDLIASKTGLTYSTTHDYKFYLFTYYPERSTAFQPQKIKQVRFWFNNVLVRDMVPAKNSSGVIGMYDLVNDVFYTNKGTGTFIGKEF